MIKNTLIINDPQGSVLFKFFLDGLFVDDNRKRFDLLYRDRITTHNSCYEFELDLIENEIQILLANDWLNDDDLLVISYLKEYFSQNYLKHYDSFLCSPVYNEKNCLERFFDEETRKVIEEKKQETLLEIDKIIKRYLNSEEISIYEMQKMFSYLNSDYISVQYYGITKKIVHMILSSKESKTLEEAKFVSRYYNRKESIENEYEEAKVYLDNRLPLLQKNGVVEYADKISAHFSKNASCHHGGMIFLNTSYTNDKISQKDLMNILANGFHEGWHQKQLSDYCHDVFSIEHFAEVIAAILFSIDEGLYRTNYDFVLHELQAYNQGWRKILELMDEYGVDGESSKRALWENKVNEAYAMILPNDSNNPVEFDTYVVQTLIKKCQERPYLVEAVSMLGLFFNQNGQMKSLEELLNLYYQNVADIKVFNPFFKYIFDNYPLNIQIDDSKKAFIDQILDGIILDELLIVKTMLKGYETFAQMIERHLSLLDKRFIGHQDELVMKKVERIRKYILLMQDYDKKEYLSGKLNKLIGENYQK